MKCKHLLLGCLALLIAGKLSAAGRYGPAELSDEFDSFNGFSEDGSLYAYSKTVGVYYGDSGGVAEGGTVLVVRSAQTGAVVKEFLLSTEHMKPASCSKEKCGGDSAPLDEAVSPQAVAIRKRLWSLYNPAAYKAFGEKNKFGCGSLTGNYNYEGDELSAASEPKGTNIHRHGRGNFLGFFFNGPDEVSETGVRRITLRLSVSHRYESDGALSAVMRNITTDGGLEGQVTVCKDLNDRRIAWLVNRFGGNKRDFGEQFFHIGPIGGPRIQLLAKAGSLPQSAAQVDAELKKLNMALINTAAGPKQAATVPTVILVRDKLEPQGQRIAALFPGSTISKLDAKSAYDIVIKLGAGPAVPTPASPAAPAPAPLGPIVLPPALQK